MIQLASELQDMLMPCDVVDPVIALQSAARRHLGDWLGATGVSWTCRGEVVDAQLTVEATRELLRTEFNRAVHSATRVPPPSFCPREVYGSSFAVHGHSRPCQSCESHAGRPRHVGTRSAATGRSGVEFIQICAWCAHRWKDLDCRGLKNLLMVLDCDSSGRVALADSYRDTLDRSAPKQFEFMECTHFLRQKVALDESDPGSN